jgi:hypothetical protein
MDHRLPILPCIAVCLLACFAVVPASLAQGGTHDRTHFGSDINVGPNEQIGEATCFGCSIHVRGHVEGDVTVFAGSIVIEDQGEVDGDVTDFGGGARLDKDTKVSGDVTVFGGQIRRDAAASVGGDVTNFSGPVWIFLIFVLPLIILAGLVILIVLLIRRLTRPSVPATA